MLELQVQPDLPKARRVLLTAAEAGLEDRLTLFASVGPESEVAPVGGVVSRSRAKNRGREKIVGADRICAYLDTLYERPKLIARAGDVRLEPENGAGCRG